MSNVPKVMKVIDVPQPGGPEALVIAERPVPEPGRGEVLIKVAAAGLNRAGRSAASRSLSVACRCAVVSGTRSLRHDRRAR
jgi:NADPH:quinone reductase-like Zn-dependent oxidoreductase